MFFKFYKSLRFPLKRKKYINYTLIILYKKGYLKIVKEFELTESSKFYYSKSQILPFDK